MQSYMCRCNVLLVMTKCVNLILAQCQHTCTLLCIHVIFKEISIVYNIIATLSILKDAYADIYCMYTCGTELSTDA